MEIYKKYLLTDDEADRILLALNDLETIFVNLPEAKKLSTMDFDELSELSTMLYEQRTEAKEA